MSDTLRTIAKELREFAGNAHGNPATVQITARTLIDYADALERLASARLAQNPPTPTAQDGKE
jgi:hypothetical protein